MIMKSKLFIMASAALGAFASMGFSAGQTNVAFGGNVPLVCKVELGQAFGTIGANGIAEIGVAQELCNARSGYRLVARTSGVAEGASLIVDGQRFAITNERDFVIAETSGPAVKSRAIALDAGNGDGGGNLTLRLEAK